MRGVLDQWRWRIALAAVVVAVLAGSLFLVVWGTVEQSRFSNRGVGVRTLNGAIDVESCVGTIGKLSVSTGQDSGRMVWSATAGTGSLLTALPITTSIGGYTVSGSSIDPASTQEFAVQVVDDSRGSPLMSTILPFIPAHLDASRITLASGDQVDEAEWRAGSDCTR